MSTSSNVVDYRGAVAAEAIKGLLGQPGTLSPWLFYHAEGSLRFEQITSLPEYYLSRTERKILIDYAAEIVLLALSYLPRCYLFLRKWECESIKEPQPTAISRSEDYVSRNDK
jgi:Histidine-specific methyltransferase, SAM-dependent